VTTISARPDVSAPGQQRRVLVTRASHSTAIAALFGVVVLVVLASLPYLVNESYTSTLVNFFILVSLAGMWNLLTGYAGLVSVGQQAYLGLGAYAVLLLAQHGMNPFVAIPIAIVVGAAFAVPASPFLFRLSGGYFAISTWVLAIVASIVITGIPSLGGGTGAALPGLASMTPVLLAADTYWASLAVAVATIAATYVLLRSRLGLVLTAVRDNEVGARSVGGRVTSAKVIVYVVAAAGCAGAGALVAISQLNVQAANVFNIQWTAYMIFAVLIGGLGSIEGPILGSIVFIVLQQELAQYNAWYLIILGTVAVVIAVWVRGGLWGAFTARVPLRLFPLQHLLYDDPGRVERYGIARFVLGPVKSARHRQTADGRGGDGFGVELVEQDPSRSDKDQRR
jgi:branched-chain amino acid transport system permease protein